MQNFSFCGSGWSFWYLFLALFCHFFMQKFSFLRGWEVFFSKKTTFFFVQNFSFCGAGWSFWVEKMAFFWDFLENVAADLVWGNPAGRSERSARGLTGDAKGVSGKPESTGRCGYEPLSLSVIERLWGNPAGRSARSARGLTRDAKAVSEKPEGTSQCGYQSLSLFAADLLHPARERAKRVIVSEVKWVKWSEWKWKWKVKKVKVSKFLIFNYP